LPEQDDLLYETLTVHETLYYAAMLRLPATMTAAQKEERVLNVIHTLGLDKCRDTIVGAWSVNI
jgi:ABC-type multidrug transport system ATPase subunit